MKSCSGEQKRGERKTAKFRTKLVVPESKISQCEENYLRLKKYLKNIVLKFMKLIPILISIMRKKIKVDENACNYILFRVDICSSEYNLAVEVDEKEHSDRISINSNIL